MQSTEFESEMNTVLASPQKPLIMANPGDDDEIEDDKPEDDWSDIDDEDFEDLAEDRDDFNEMNIENDVLDPDDDDHLPDDDF